MPYPCTNTVEASTTAAGAWKRLFQSAENGGRSGVSIRAFSGNAQPLWVCVLQKGATAPTEPSSALDEASVSFSVDPGVTYPIYDWADRYADVYVRAPDGSQIGYRAVEVVG